MGDGQHIWASAEWVLMIRNCFVMEDGAKLILCAGLPPRWLQAGEPLSIRQAPTAFGTVSVSVQPTPKGTVVAWSGSWRGKPPIVEVRLAGRKPYQADFDQTSAEFSEAAG